MHDQKMNRGLAVMVFITACVLIFNGASSAAGVKKKKQAKKAAAPAAAVKAPEIRRIAVFGDQGTERILHSPVALTRDNKNGDLFIVSPSAGEVVVLDRNGELLKRIGLEEQLAAPSGVALDADGRIFISDVETAFLTILGPSGALEEEIDLIEAAGRTVAPGRVTLGQDGLLYLADVHNDEIIVMTRKGGLVKRVGKFSYLQKAGSIGDGKILAISAYGTAVQIYDKDGRMLRSFGEHGDTSEKNFSFPTGFAVDSKGRLWIAEAFQHRIKVYTTEGTLLFNFGKLERDGDGFIFPVDLCFGEHGELFVLEKGANRVQVFEVSDLKS